MLKDVRVIAIDQQLVQGAAGANGEGRVAHRDPGSDAGGRGARGHRDQAGAHLSLAVRPVDAAPSDQGSAHPVTWAGDVSNAYHAGQEDTRRAATQHDPYLFWNVR